MNTFSEHKSIKNNDGTFNILEVPIFELGEHRGTKYDENWASDAVANFSTLKGKNFLPRVIVGHTDDKSENPAVGFLDNLKVQGKQVMAGLVNLKKEIFEQIKDKAWPSRSVEVNPEKKKFTALALLGGTEPFFPFEPIDVKFQADPEGQWVEFPTDDLETKLSLLDKLIQKFQDVIQAIHPPQDDKQINYKDIDMTPEELKTLTEKITADVQAQFDKRVEEAARLKFKEIVGVEPEKFQEAQAAEKKQKFSENKTRVITNIKTMGLAPAVVDGYLAPIIDFAESKESETIKFAEKEQGNIFTLVEKFSQSLKDRFDKKTLFVEFDEKAKFAGGDDNPNLNVGDINDRQKLFEEIRKFQADQKIEKFEDAAIKYAELHPNRK
jgi:hypothetical protein